MAEGAGGRASLWRSEPCECMTCDARRREDARLCTIFTTIYQ